MSSSLIIGLELLLVFGCVVGFGVFELMSLRKGRARTDDAKVLPDRPAPAEPAPREDAP